MVLFRPTFFVFGLFFTFGCAHKFTPEEDASINLEADSFFKSVAKKAFIRSCANAGTDALNNANEHISAWENQYQNEIREGQSFMRLLQNPDGSYVNYTPELALDLLSRTDREPKEFYQEPLCAHLHDVYKLKSVASKK